MSQLTSRGLDNTSSAFVSDTYIETYIEIYRDIHRDRYMIGDIFWKRVIDYNF